VNFVRDEINLFTWNDLVTIKSNAPSFFLPGESAAVCGISQITTEKEAEQLHCKNGEWIYIVEFGDGSSIEVPESYLEKYVEPQCYLLIEQEAFTDKSAACLGSQLIELAHFFEQAAPFCTWHAADLDCYGNDHLREFSGYSLKKLGGYKELIQLSEHTVQFLSGVFIAANHSGEMEKAIEVSTEDERFRPIDCDDVLIEIRAFDTSYFEVYSAFTPLLEELSNHFGGKNVVTCESN